MDKKKILITAAGGLTGTFLTKHFYRLGYEVYGVDMSDNIPLKSMLIKSFTVPASSDPRFIKEVKDIVIENDIDYVIPVSSYDMNVFSNYVLDPIFGAKMLIIDNDTNHTLHDKETCYKYFSSIGIRTPQILSIKNNNHYPVVIKPKEGSGSKGFHVLNSEKDFKYWSAELAEFIVMEYLDGREFTVDCLFDQESKCVGYNIRERQKMTGGGAVISQNNYQYESFVDKTIKILEKTHLLKGAVNFQFKIVEDKLVLFDFNTRLASGGLALTVASGFDIPKLLIDLIDNKKVDAWKCPEEKRYLKMIRYYEEVFV